MASDDDSLLQVIGLLGPVWSSELNTSVICCDSQQVLVLRPEEGTRMRKIIGCHITPPNLVALKILLTRYLLIPVILLRYILRIDGDEDVDVHVVGRLLPLSSVPILPDSIIFNTYNRHSDFDPLLLLKSPTHKEQFCRWKAHMINVAKSCDLCVGDVILGKTNKFARFNPLLRLYYPAAIRPPGPNMETFDKQLRPDLLHDPPGILIEYIDALTISRNSTQTLSDTEQLQPIQSMRHGVRILQYADISQHDWHGGQILIRRSSNGTAGSLVHCIFIDFAACSQNLTGGEDRAEDDFIGGLGSLAGPVGL